MDCQCNLLARVPAGRPRDARLNSSFHSLAVGLPGSSSLPHAGDRRPHQPKQPTSSTTSSSLQLPPLFPVLSLTLSNSSRSTSYVTSFIIFHQHSFQNIPTPFFESCSLHCHTPPRPPLLPSETVNLSTFAARPRSATAWSCPCSSRTQTTILSLCAIAIVAGRPGFCHHIRYTLEYLPPAPQSSLMSPIQFSDLPPRLNPTP